MPHRFLGNLLLWDLISRQEIPLQHWKPLVDVTENFFRQLRSIDCPLAFTAIPSDSEIDSSLLPGEGVSPQGTGDRGKERLLGVTDLERAHRTRRGGCGKRVWLGGVIVGKLKVEARQICGVGLVADCWLRCHLTGVLGKGGRVIVNLGQIVTLSNTKWPRPKIVLGNTM